MSELMPRDYYNPVPIKRDTRKRLARIEQEAVVRQAALEAAAEDAAYQMEAREQLAAGQALPTGTSTPALVWRAPNPEEGNMDELELRHYLDPVRLARDTRKRMAQIEQEAAVKRRAMEAAAGDTAYQIEVKERLATYQDLLHAQGTNDLADYDSHRATQLYYKNTQRSQGEPFLEGILRGFGQAAAISEQMRIHHRGTDR